MAIDKERVAEVLNLIRPSLQNDGGDVALIDVAEDGTVTVELKFHAKRVLLSVEDTGRGIAPEHLEALFDRYLHGEPLAPAPQGLGLGLAPHQLHLPAVELLHRAVPLGDEVLPH